MRIACLGRAARAIIASQLAVTAGLWTFLAVSVDHLDPEDFGLAGWATLAVTLTSAATVIAIAVRDSIRGALLEAITASRPDGAAAPLHLVKTEDAG